MSLSGRAEGVARLRRAIEEIEARSASAAEPRPEARLSLGAQLDAQLGGGLAVDALHEIAPAAPADGAAAMGFALSLAARYKDSDVIPYSDGLAAGGLKAMVQSALSLDSSR